MCLIFRVNHCEKYCRFETKAIQNLDRTWSSKKESKDGFFTCCGNPNQIILQDKPLNETHKGNAEREDQNRRGGGA